MRRLVTVTVRSRSDGIRGGVCSRDSGRGNSRAVIVGVAVDRGRNGTVGGGDVIVLDGRGGGGTSSSGCFSSSGSRISRGGASCGGSGRGEFVHGVHRLVVRVNDPAAGQRYVQLKRSRAVGLLRRWLGGRGGGRLVRRGARQHRESNAARAGTVHGVQLLDQEVPLGRLVDLHHFDASSHAVRPVTVRTLVERRRDKHRLGRDPPTGHTAAADATASGARAAGGQQFVPGRRHQLFLDDDPAADVLVLALLEVRGRPAGQQQQQQSAQTQRSGHAS